MELYSERGFENTTVAEIAERAGLTERTFFRYFADKREVLFWGAGALQELLIRKVEEAPGSLPPVKAVVWALQNAATGMFEERRDFARRRQAIISANVELQERELVKLATLATAVAGALGQRGAGAPAASLAAEAGIAIFKVSFERWTADSGAHTLSEIIRECADDLAALTAGSTA
jgi:AcrR family transcriptional regulator